MLRVVLPGPVSGSHHYWKGFWRLADPTISLASMASILLGTCAAAAGGSIHFGWLAVTIVGIFAIEVAKNASGEIVDFDSGTDLAVGREDYSPFSGGKRVLVDELLTRNQTAVLSAICYALGVAAGLWIVIGREPQVLWVGLIGVGCAYFYHAPPLRLSYRGLGEVAVGICYGPLIALGTYLVQRGEITLHLLLLAMPLGVLVAAFLWINEFPDYTADKASAKRTLVVRLGRKRASRFFVMILALAFLTLAVLPAAGFPWTVWLGFAALMPAASASVTLWRYPEATAQIIPAQGKALLSFLLFSIGTAVGLLI